MFRILGTAALLLVLGGSIEASPARAQGAGPAAAPPLFYCTAKTASNGCIPFLTTDSGGPSVSATGAWLIRGKDHVSTEAGRLIYSCKKSSLNFHGGKLCVKAPFVQGTVAKNKQIQCIDPFASCATTSCRELRTDFNAVISNGGGTCILTCGQTVFAQVWQRDPTNPIGFGDNLTNAVKFSIGP